VKRPTLYQILRFAASAAIVAVVVVFYSKVLHANPTTVGFTFLLAVLIVSASWGLRYATFMAILATLTFNYFFLPPLYQFTIADPQNWVALFAFLFTAVIASQLAERARRAVLQSDQRRNESSDFTVSVNNFSSAITYSAWSIGFPTM